MRAVVAVGLFFIGVGLASAPAARGDEPAPAAPTPATATAEVDRLIAQLRSEKQAERESAAAALVKVGAPALDRLEAELARDEGLAIRVRAVLGQIDPSRAARQAERWYEAKFREAARRVERGDPLGAVKVVDALLALEPDCPIRDRLVALRQRAKELEMRANVIEARLVPRRVLVGPGEPIEVALEVKNISSAPLELALPEKAEGGIFGALEVETLEALPNGERRRRREIQKIDRPIQGELRPGEVWRATVRIADDRLLPAVAAGERAVAPGGLYRRVTVSGSIRSQVLVRRDERFDRFLPLFPVEVHVADRARHGLAADPRRAAAEAIEALRRKPPEEQARALGDRLFFAAMLVPSSSREDAIAALGATLEAENDPAAPAAMGALAVLVDPPLELDRSGWRAWLRRHAN